MRYRLSPFVPFLAQFAQFAAAGELALELKPEQVAEANDEKRGDGQRDGQEGNLIEAHTLRYAFLAVLHLGLEPVRHDLASRSEWLNPRRTLRPPERSDVEELTNDPFGFSLYA